MLNEERYKNALKAIAALEGDTLLGCADENCDFYPDCDEREKRAHERGAWRAFGNAARIAKEALGSCEECWDCGKSPCQCCEECDLPKSSEAHKQHCPEAIRG